MAKECAFCPHAAKLSGEHLWSEWMSGLLPGVKRLIRRDEFGRVISLRKSNEIDWTAKVVCKPCNESWMSDIEAKHAKPAMADLILGKTDIPITQSRANSLAIFAFKAAVIFDHMRRSFPPFFSKESRFLFRQTLEIPLGISMWLTEFKTRHRGEAFSVYYGSEVPPGDEVKMYVFTYGVGHLIFQVVSCFDPKGAQILPSTGFEHLSVPFWPDVHPAFIWPPPDVLRTPADFQRYALRWTDITFVR